MKTSQEQILKAVEQVSNVLPSLIQRINWELGDVSTVKKLGYLAQITTVQTPFPLSNLSQGGMNHFNIQIVAIKQIASGPKKADWDGMGMGELVEHARQAKMYDVVDLIYVAFAILEEVRSVVGYSQWTIQAKPF